MDPVLVASIVTLLIPLWILLGIVVLFGAFALLGRVENGRYIRPIVMTLAKVPLLRRGMEKASNAALERTNPELASAMKKIQRHGARLNDPQQAQRAMSQLTRQERRALLEMQEQQGVQPVAPEATNRQMRRRLEKAQRNVRRK
jgi:biopolymer transport protein ExbB/TolQ